MARSSLFPLSFILLTSSLFSTFARAVDLPEVELLPLGKNGRPTTFQKRAEGGNDINGLDLKDFGTFLWGTEGNQSFSLNFPGTC